MDVGRRPATRRPPTPTIYAITVASVSANALLGVALPEVTADLGAAPSAAGVIVAAATLPGIILAPVMGVLADRYGRREVLVPCLTVFGLAGGLAALAPTWPVLVALRFLQGVGSSGLANLAIVVVGDHWEGQQRATLIGRNAAVLTTSLFVLPMVAGVVTDLLGWRFLFAVFFAALGIAVVVQRTLAPSAGRDIRISEQLGAALPLLRSRQVLGIVISGALVFALIFGLLLTVLPVYLSSEFGLSASVRGILLGLPALPNTAAALALGWLHVRVARRAQLLVAGVLLALGALLPALTSSLPLLVAGVMIFGAAEGLTVPTLQTLAAGAGPASSRGAVVATFVGGARLGQTVGPIAGGAAMAAAGPRSAFALGAVVALALVAVVATTIRSGDADT